MLLKSLIAQRNEPSLWLNCDEPDVLQTLQAPTSFLEIANKINELLTGRKVGCLLPFSTKLAICLPIFLVYRG